MNNAIEDVRKSIEEIISETDEVQLLLYTVEEDIQIFRKGNARFKAENAKLRALVHKNYYLTVSEREALRQARYDDDTYLKALDAEIMNAKNQMSELGIEVDV